MGANVGLPAPVVGELRAEPDDHALPRPALGGAANHALAVVVARVLEGRVARVEVDVVGDRDLGDAALDGQLRVHVDRDGAVRRLLGVEVRVEGQVLAATGRSRSLEAGRSPLVTTPG